ncbi:hypothetical protein COU74_01990 [Candidatus Peregrinibacteria bacterium CG10_big_fil_rev_8_21_14_0_10_36_19]|nr:MAG: hypothetical protein COU74_01990 [Candidatus Peregrinibacteria bacterium CG10_big_fil_rev_8_21_14_0_10_36_19]
MRKFTIFTVILTVVITVVVAQLLTENYLPNSKSNNSDEVKGGDFNLPTTLDLSKTVQTNLLGAGEQQVPTPDAAVGESFSSGIQYENVSLGTPNTTPPTIETNGISDFEDETFTSLSANVYLRDEQVQSAGFIDAIVEKEDDNGFLFKTVYVDDLYDVEMVKNSIKGPSSVLAKAYVFKIGPMSSANDVYEILKVRGSEGLEVEINETNSFGEKSFYINDSRRQNVAFLTVKISNLIYAFSYPKEYHVQIGNLVKLLDMEF